MRSFARWLWRLIVVCLVVIARVHSDDLSSSTQCKKPLQRQEWRRMPLDLKLDYIRAVKCVMKLPAITPFTGVKTRFDDFQALHISLTYEIHWVGQFLHWHRRFVALYEKTLREQCGYKGAAPYWDWTIDADSGTIQNSPVFDPQTGFGGNGEYIPGYAGPFGNGTGVMVPGTGGGCLLNGPFQHYNLSVGPGTLVTNHCITRGINDNLIQYMTTAQVQNTTKQPNFELFRQEVGAAFPPVFGGVFVPPPWKIHDGAHNGVNGEMGNVFSSPGDPLFYVHHANLDRVWALWQDKDPARFTDVSGYTTVAPPYTNLTLDFKLKASTLGPLVAIRDVMNTRGPLLCYEYV